MSFENERYKFIALADGVSECTNGKDGADIACETVAQLFLSCGNLFFNSIPEKAAYLIISEVLDRLSKKSNSKDENVRSYSSTLCFACLDNESKKILTFQLGDSCIFTVSEKGVEKTNLQYENAFTTTLNAEDYVQIKFIDATTINSIMLCSDGAWKLMYDGALLINGVIADIKETRLSAVDNYFDYLCPNDDCSYIFMDLKS